MQQIATTTGSEDSAFSAATSPADPDARITKMKDGRTHLAHKAEHPVDLSSGASLAVLLEPASEGDTTSVHKTLEEDWEISIPSRYP